MGLFPCLAAIFTKGYKYHDFLFASLDNIILPNGTFTANSSCFWIDLFHIVCAHAYMGHVSRYFSIIDEALQRWGKRILSH